MATGPSVPPPSFQLPVPPFPSYNCISLVSCLRGRSVKSMMDEQSFNFMGLREDAARRLR
jgi:hypothetical protein